MHPSHEVSARLDSWIACHNCLELAALWAPFRCIAGDRVQCAKWNKSKSFSQLRCYAEISCLKNILNKIFHKQIWTSYLIQPKTSTRKLRPRVGALVTLCIIIWGCLIVVAYYLDPTIALLPNRMVMLMRLQGRASSTVLLHLLRNRCLGLIAPTDLLFLCSNGYLFLCSNGFVVLM